MPHLTGISGAFHDRVALRLRGFFLASLCVHAGLLLVLAPTPEFGQHAPAQTSLSIRLSLAEPAATSVPRHTAAAPPQKHAKARLSHPSKAKTAVPHSTKRATAPAVADATQPAHAPQPTSNEPVSTIPEKTARSSDATAAAAARAEGVDQDHVRGRIRALLLTDLARRFTYPVLAQRRGWQGKVLLSITIRPSGMLEHVQVAQSSGYDVLDHAAVATIQRVGQIAEVGERLRGETLQLSLPIVYRLTN